MPCVACRSTFYPGELVAIMGQRPAPARSTLMNTLGRLDKPTGGTYVSAG